MQLKGASERHLILETKGYDPLESKKVEAAERWVNAVNADGRYGLWSYPLLKKPEDVGIVLSGMEEPA